jgi:hypothetical protein
MTIRTIEPPGLLPLRKFRCRKDGCNALLEASRADATREVHDREGRAYVFTCPHCATELVIGANVFKMF